MNREGAKDTTEEKEGNAVLPTLPFGNPYGERERLRRTRFSRLCGSFNN